MPEDADAVRDGMLSAASKSSFCNGFYVKAKKSETQKSGDEAKAAKAGLAAYVRASKMWGMGLRSTEGYLLQHHICSLERSIFALHSRPTCRSLASPWGMVKYMMGQNVLCLFTYTGNRHFMYKALGAALLSAFYLHCFC